MTNEKYQMENCFGLHLVGGALSVYVLPSIA
jgi:hypothetical protein